MEEKEKILTENFQEYFNSGNISFVQKKFNSATTLFFKALAALCDLYILKKEGKIPSSHSERFRILESKYPKIYQIIDRDFPFYQESYTQKMDEEAAKLLHDDVKEIKKILEE